MLSLLFVAVVIVATVAGAELVRAICRRSLATAAQPHAVLPQPEPDLARVD